MSLMVKTSLPLREFVGITEPGQTRPTRDNGPVLRLMDELKILTAAAAPQRFIAAMFARPISQFLPSPSYSPSW
jgi:hypothetical protein